MSRYPDQRQRLIDGFNIFRSLEYERLRQRYNQLATEGQKPPMMVVACSDSRVDPATVFRVAPGEMFVLRHIAALVPPCERDGRHHSASAAIEFAVTQLNVEHIMVFGHGGCGGIAASLSGCFDHCEEGDGGFVHHWMNIIAPARDAVIEKYTHASPEQRQLALELKAIRTSLDRLRAFPGVAEREAQGLLHLHGVHFELNGAVLRWLDPIGGTFRRIGDDSGDAETV